MNEHDATPKADGAESLSTAGLGVLVISGECFVEATPHGNEPPNYACDGCAFLGNPIRCGLVIDRLATAAFGGDCNERNVIYVDHPKSPSSALGKCCYGGIKTQAACASCAAWAETPNVELTGAARYERE